MIRRSTNVARILGASLLLATAGPACAAKLAYSTYWGGTGDESEYAFEGSASIAVDAQGNFYVAGTTPSADFPTTPGLPEAPHGGLDIFVTKTGPTGALIYSTVLGGPCDDAVRDIAVDAAGNAYFTGRVNGGGNCYDDSLVAGVLVAKLDPEGNLVYATAVGGSLADSSVGQAIAIDAEGHAYVAGTANSASHDFPTTPGTLRTGECANVFEYANDGFVLEVGAQGDEILRSTILCGRGDDSPSGIAVDAAGDVYVAGTTGSSDFPTVHPIQAARRNGPAAVTGFVTKLGPDLSQVLYSTYLGGSDNDWLTDLAVDAQGNAYVTGETESTDFPTTPGALQEHAGYRLCLETLCTDAFVTKIDASGSALAYSTYLYGELYDRGAGIAVDAAGEASVVGTTTSSYFPILNAFQPQAASVGDAFVAKLNPQGTGLVYSTYLGGHHSGDSPSTGWDAGLSIALDPSGNACVAGYTQSYDFPTTFLALASHLSTGGDPNREPAICDTFGTPCGDVFFARVDGGGPGLAPPIDVSAPEAAAPGGTLVATWAGIPTPTATDALELYALGAGYGDPRDVVAWSPTTGTGDGTVSIAIPADAAPGVYELRLVIPDPNYSNLPEIVARSAPIRIGSVTTTTIPDPAQPLCELGGVCDDGDPCTVDDCVPGGGCRSTPATGVASVSCTCRRPMPEACADRSLPASIARRRARACSLFADAAGASPKRLRRGAGAIKSSLAAVAKARRRRKLSDACADALSTELVDARERAARLLASRP